MEIGEKIVKRIKRHGMYQKITFKLEVENTAFGKVKVLKTDKTVPLAKVSELAQEYGLPIKSAKINIVLPLGKMLKDYVIED